MALEYPFEHPVTLFQALDMPVDTRIDAETLLTFGKVLMGIAGADNNLSMWERGWLSTYMSAYGAPESVLAVLDDYDYRDVDIEPLLTPLLDGRYGKWVRRSLVQGSIRMSQTDKIVSREHTAIVRAANLIGMSEDAVSEVHSLTETFDTTTTTIARLIATTDNEDAGTDLSDWNESAPPAPERLLFGREEIVFARALLYVIAADGEVSESEMNAFTGYMQRWGASEQQIAQLHATDIDKLNAQSVAERLTDQDYTLNALASVALRLAGVDGLHPLEENALRRLYKVTGERLTTYYAIRGLEDIRRLAQTRLNTLFSRYL